MSVSPETVRKIAALARLRLEEGEVERLARDMTDVLGHMDVLARADTSGVEGAWAVVDGPGPLRSGREGAPDPLLVPPAEMAPDFRDGFFAVPRLEAMDASAREATGEGVGPAALEEADGARGSGPEPGGEGR